METLINNINTHIKQVIEKQVLEYFTQYEDKISEKISSAYNLKYENVKQMVSCIIHERNQVEPKPVKSVCIGKTKAGKSCKYTCVGNGNMCNKHLKMSNEESKKGESSKKSLKEEHAVLSSLPPDEASWFQKYSNNSNYTKAYYPDPELGSDSEDCIVNE